MQKIFTISDDYNDQRLDLFLISQLPDYSRSYFKTLIEEKKVFVNNETVRKAGHTIKTGDTVVVEFPESRTFTEHHNSVQCIQSRIELIHEDKDFAIIYKPAGIVTHHPSDKSKEFSLVDWLTYKFSHIKDVGYSDRPGIVHRLDKDTSGLMVIALNNKGHKNFGDLFHDRKIDKIYYALVQGLTPADGIIKVPLGRDPFMPHKMAVVANGRQAMTEYKAIEHYKEHTLLEVKLLTGRTHQIRLHCRHIGHPLEGDSVYNKKSPLIARQALHAAKLAFEYEGKQYSFERELPDDFKSVLEYLKKNLI